MQQEQTQAEIEWMNNVDMCDPFYGPPEQLEALLETAPTPELKIWLAEQIEANKAFSAQLFSGGAQR